MMRGSSSDQIIQVQGGHIIRSTGRKDRHSKVYTSKGPRDRRVRLSAHTAIQFYDVQDRLGYDRPSKALDWLIQKAKDAINELPPWNPIIVTAAPSPDDSNPSSSEPAALDQQSDYLFMNPDNGSSSLLMQQIDHMKSSFLSTNSLSFPEFANDQVMTTTPSDLGLSLQTDQNHENANANPLLSGSYMVGFPESFQRMESSWNRGNGNTDDFRNFGSFLMNSGQAISQQNLNYSSGFQFPDQRELLQSNLPVHASDHHHQYSAARGDQSSDSGGRFSLGFHFPESQFYSGNDEEGNQ